MHTNRKIAIVTGANRGLGLETCRQLAQMGLTVILTSRDRVKGQAAVDALRAHGLEVLFHPLDVTDAGSIGRLGEFIANDYGRIDVLVNNAGVFLDPIGAGDPSACGVLRADVDTLRATMETNLYGNGT